MTPDAGPRENLRGVVADSAVAYGYTLTIFSTGSVGGDILGRPQLAQTLLLVAGAAAGFLAVEFVAFGTPRPRLRSDGPKRIAAWGGAQLLPAAAAISTSWIVLQIIAGSGAWAAIGFTASGVYFLGAALQLTLAQRMT